MDLEFTDERLALLETPRAADTQLPVAVIQSARQRLNLLRAAPDEATMLGWRSLRYEGGGTPDCPERSVRIEGQWKMLLRVNQVETPTKLFVTAVVEQRRPEGVRV